MGEILKKTQEIKRGYFMGEGWTMQLRNQAARKTQCRKAQKDKNHYLFTGCICIIFQKYLYYISKLQNLFDQRQQGTG